MNIFFPSARIQIFLAPIGFFRAKLACLRIQLKLSLSTFYSDVIYQFNLFSARTTLWSNAIQSRTRKDYPKTLLSIEPLNWVFSNDSSSYKYYIRIRKWHESRLLSYGRLYGVTRRTGYLKINHQRQFFLLVEIFTRSCY